MCGFAVKHPNGQIVHPYEWRQSAEYADQTSTGGYYAVCIDNQFSRFAGKLVNLYLSVIRYDMWDKYAKEVEELDMNIKNFTVSKLFINSFLYLLLAIRYLLPLIMSGNTCYLFLMMIIATKELYNYLC